MMLCLRYIDVSITFIWPAFWPVYMLSMHYFVCCDRCITGEGAKDFQETTEP